MVRVLSGSVWGVAGSGSKRMSEMRTMMGPGRRLAAVALAPGAAPAAVHHPGTPPATPKKKHQGPPPLVALAEKKEEEGKAPAH